MIQVYLKADPSPADAPMPDEFVVGQARIDGIVRGIKANEVFQYDLMHLAKGAKPPSWATPVVTDDQTADAEIVAALQNEGSFAQQWIDGWLAELNIGLPDPYAKALFVPDGQGSWRPLRFSELGMQPLLAPHTLAAVYESRRRTARHNETPVEPVFSNALAYLRRDFEALVAREQVEPRTLAQLRWCATSVEHARLQLLDAFDLNGPRPWHTVAGWRALSEVARLIALACARKLDRRLPVDGMRSDGEPRDAFPDFRERVSNLEDRLLDLAAPVVIARDEASLAGEPSTARAASEVALAEPTAGTSATRSRLTRGEVGIKLLQLLERKPEVVGWSRQQLADEVGTSRSTVCRALELEGVATEWNAAYREFQGVLHRRP